MNTDSLINECTDDSNLIELAPTVTVDNLRGLLTTTDWKVNVSYVKYMEFVKTYSAQEILEARAAETDFINNATIIERTGTIIRATKSGFITKLIYNNNKVITLNLRDQHVTARYAPVPYVNDQNPAYSVENFIFNYDNLINTPLYKAIRFHETNIPTRYAGQKHGPKRVGTFYKTYCFESWLIRHSSYGLTKYSPEQCNLKKGPGDNHPDFKYVDKNRVCYAEAKMGMDIDAAISACEKVHMSPFPNKILILKDDVTLEVYNLDEAKRVTAKNTYEIDLPKIPNLLESW